MSRVRCPLSQIEDGLDPYIHSREQTTRIRQIITANVLKHVRGDFEISHLLLSTPSVSIQGDVRSNPANGLYQQYLQALTAHRKAQERYRTIKSELDELLKDKNGLSNPPLSRNSADTARDYAKILRQRRQHRKLEIVHDALTKLVDSESDPCGFDIKQRIRERIGEPPQAPITNFNASGESNSNMDNLTLQLKKDLIVAKNKYKEANMERRLAEDRTRIDQALGPDEAIVVFKRVRQELISWIEGELAKISEDPTEASQAEISFLNDREDDAYDNHEQISPSDLSTQIAHLYEQYLEARKHHIHQAEAAVDHIHNLEPCPETRAGASFTTSPTRRPTISTASSGVYSTNSIQSSHILPYLNTITSITKDEALLQQQSSHLRQQINLASTETDAVVQRLAGESLLVPQGSVSISAWTKAAQNAKMKTEETIVEQVKEGNASVGDASIVLQSLRARKQALQSLKHDL